MTYLERSVLELLQDIKGEKLELADLEKDLTRDLKLTSDDLTFVFAIGLEKKLGLKVPIDAWCDVKCGRDAVRLFEALGRAEER